MSNDTLPTKEKFWENLFHLMDYAEPNTPVGVLVAPALGAKSILDVSYDDTPVSRRWRAEHDKRRLAFFKKLS